MASPGQWVACQRGRPGVLYSPLRALNIAKMLEGGHVSANPDQPGKERDYDGSTARCTWLVYEFAIVVDSHLTGKHHLAKAGVLSALEKAN
jgi:hypothetical protein